MTSKSCLVVSVLCVAACDRTSVSGTAAAAPPPSTSAPRTASPPAQSSAPSASPGPIAPARESKVTFDGDAVGGPAPAFEATVGDWYVGEEFGARVFKVDGSRWRDGQPSANLADQAKRLYGDRYAEFLDGVKAFAFFPFAIWKQDPPRGDLRISVRFFPVAGKIDQAAGIVYDVAPDGSYWGVRANALEDNLLFFRVVKGKRTVIENVRAVSTPTRVWHTLTVELRGKRLLASLDGQQRLDRKLDAAPTGRLGVWSKADSQVLFDDFTVTSLAPTD